jgi:hypothetical protein
LRVKLPPSYRGLGPAHRALRARFGPIVRAGAAVCCLCGEVIEPGQAWDLDHTPDRTGYRGVAHATCNRSDGGRRGNAKRGVRRSRKW